MDTRFLGWAVVVVSLFAAALVVGTGLWQTPTYEAAAKVRLDLQKKSEPQSNLAGSGEEIQTLPPPGWRRELQALTQTMTIAIDTRPVAEEASQRLVLETSPDVLLSNLSIEQVENSQFIQLSYADNDPEEAKRIVNTVGQVSSERISEMSVSKSAISATIVRRATVPDEPVSPKPLRNGLIALVGGLTLSGALHAWHRQRTL